MPELPEVEAVARTLRPLVRGQTVFRCRVLHPIAARPQGARVLRRGVEGQRILGVERQGKYLLLRLARGCLVMHFRLNGQLVWFPRRVGRRGPFFRASRGEARPLHIDVALEMQRGTLGFVDRRHFGRVQWYPRAEDCPGVRALGMDPLSLDSSLQQLLELLGRSRRPLKLFLMDQTRIAGLGNIYANEALSDAWLSPRRPAHRLTPGEAARLHKGIVNVLRRALECCLHPAPDFQNPEWWFQGLESILNVYGREGQPCRWCRRPIRRIEQGGRSSYFCAHCQR